MLKKLTVIAWAFLISSQVNAVELNVDSNGNLFGATNVNVGGTLYDVEFVDGSCVSLFDGCDSPDDFTFKTEADALTASQALLDSVFVDSRDHYFDTTPALTTGCGPTFICSVFTPYESLPNFGDLVYSGMVNQADGEGGDGVLFFVASMDFSTTCCEDLSNVYAVWSPSINPLPECDIQLNQRVYVDGDTVTLDTLRISNLTGVPVIAELKVWRGAPGMSPISLTNLGADGSLMLPAGFDDDVGPTSPVPLVTADLPRGNYEFSCRMLDPVTGELLFEDLNPFVISNYAIGQTGPAGGIVFYVAPDGVHGLEAAPEILESAEWGCSEIDIEGAAKTEIGTGAQNSVDILAGCAEPGIAAAVANTYTLNGYSDWFLPSIDELRELYFNRFVLDSNGYAYWASSQTGASDAWSVRFTSGFLQNTDNKNSAHTVSPIRAF